MSEMITDEHIRMMAMAYAKDTEMNTEHDAIRKVITRVIPTDQNKEFYRGYVASLADILKLMSTIQETDLEIDYDKLKIIFCEFLGTAAKNFTTLY